MAGHSIISTHTLHFILLKFYNCSSCQRYRALWKQWQFKLAPEFFYSNAHLNRFNVVTIIFNDKCILDETILPLNGVENDEKEPKQKQMYGACVPNYHFHISIHFELMKFNICIQTFAQKYFEEQLRFKHE